MTTGKYKDETDRMIRLIKNQYGTIRRFCIVNRLDETEFRDKLLRLKRHRGIYINRANPTPEEQLEGIYKLLKVKRW